MLKVNSP